jgi:hypothetical protein
MGPGGDDDSSGDDSGDDVGAGPDAAPAPDFAVSVSPTNAATTLGTETRYTITLDSANFTGDVALSAQGVPAGWTATFTPSPSVTMPLDGSVVAELVIAVPSDAAASNANIVITAAGAPGTRTAVGALAVANEYVFDIPDGTRNGAHPFPGTLRLKLGAKLRLRTMDTMAPHRIHSDGGLGFPHQDASMTAGQEYDATPGEAGTFRFYCHDHGEGLGATNLTVVQ